jgi:hypothetical protein
MAVVASVLWMILGTVFTARSMFLENFHGYAQHFSECLKYHGANQQQYGPCMANADRIFQNQKDSIWFMAPSVTLGRLLFAWLIGSIVFFGTYWVLSARPIIADDQAKS